MPAICKLLRYQFLSFFASFSSPSKVYFLIEILLFFSSQRLFLLLLLLFLLQICLNLIAMEVLPNLYRSHIMQRILCVLNCYILFLIEFLVSDPCCNEASY